MSDIQKSDLEETREWLEFENVINCGATLPFGATIGFVNTVPSGAAEMFEGTNADLISPRKINEPRE